MFSFPWRRWVDRRGLKQSGRRSRRQSARPLALELLEDRCLLAAGLSSYGQVPLSFEANQGQTDAQVDYVARGSGYALFLTPGGATLSLQQVASDPGSKDFQVVASDVLRLQLVGANPSATHTGVDLQANVSNYIIGNDPSQWHTGVSNYGRVEYDNVYTGINAVYYGNQSQLEYDFVVNPGAQPGQIELSFTGQQGLEIDGSGNLVLHTSAGDVVERAPVAYQDTAAGRQAVTSNFTVLSDGNVGIVLGSYDPSLPLVIDPEVNYATYYGGTGADRGNGIAVDSFGNAYVTGTTSSLDFPLALPLSGSVAGGVFDVFVGKLNAAGSGFDYSTYFGGAGFQNATGIAVDASGDAFIVGYTNSTNFPTTPNAPQKVYGLGNYDAFVAEFSPNGQTLVYSTYLGGTGDDHGFGIALDSAGNAYVTGDTSSQVAGQAASFPIVSAAQSTLPFQNAYTTANGGSLWTATNTGLLDATVTSFVVDPTNASNVYASTLDGGVFKSTNAGASWLAVNGGLTTQATLNVNTLIADPSGNIFAGTNGGVFKLNAGAATWNLLGTNLGNNVVHALARDSNNTIYAGTDGGVFKLNGGAGAWTAATTGITNPVVQVLLLDPTNNSIVYAGTAGGGVYKSVNGGGAWVGIDNGLLNLNVKGLVFNPAVGPQGRLYAAAIGSGPGNGAVFISADAGASWFASTEGLLNVDFRSLAMDAAGNVYAGTAAGVFKTSDNGATWNIFNAGLTNVSVTAITPAAGTLVYAGAQQTAGAFATKYNTQSGGNGAIVYSTLMGGTRDQQGHAITVDSANNAYVTGYTTSINYPVAGTAVQTFNGDEKSFRSTDNGQDWTVTDNGLPRGTLQALAADPFNPNIVYAGTQAGGVFKSTDGGVTWTAANVGLTNLTVNKLVAVRSTVVGGQTVLYAGTQAGVFVSTDQAVTWTFKPFPAGANAPVQGPAVVALAVEPLNSNLLLVATAVDSFSNVSSVLRSTDGGTTWTRVDNTLTGQVTTLAVNAFAGDDRYYAGTIKWGMYESFDQGLTWQPANAGFPNDTANPPNITITALISTADGSAYAGVQSNGIGVGIWKSNFSPFTNFSIGLPSLNVSTFAVDPNNPDIVYAGLTIGGVVRTTNGGITWTSVNGISPGVFNPNRLTNFNVTALSVNSNSTTVNAGFFQNLVPTADAFVTKLNSAGNSFTYSSYIGGNKDDVAQGIALGPNNDVYLAGYTNSGAFPIVHPLNKQNVIHPGGTFGYDGFITRMSVTNPLVAQQVVYSTFLGGGDKADKPNERNPEGDDYINGIVVDSNGYANVVGNTTSTDFPKTDTAFEQGFSGGINQGDAFVARITSNPQFDFTGISSDGEAPPDYATYLGGAGDDAGLAIALDSSLNQYVTGFTASTDLLKDLSPKTIAQASIGGNNTGGVFTDAFIAKIVPIPTTTTLTIQVAPSALGMQYMDVTLTSILSTTSSAGFGTAFSRNSFYDGNTYLGTGNSDGKGNQVLTVRGVPITTNHTYFVWFGGDLNHLPSKSLPITLVASSTAVAASAGPTAQRPTFTATVSPTTPGGPTPTGFVTFMVNGTVLPNQTVQPAINPSVPGNPGVPVTDRGGFGLQYGVALVNGQATYTPPFGFTPGSYQITAVYSGDLNYMPSTSPILQQALPQSATFTTLISDISGPVFGQPVKLTATVQPLAAGLPLPNGTVTFRDGQSVIGQSTLTNGLATLTTANLSVGTHTIIAFFIGNTNYSTSSSAALVLPVVKAGTQLLLATVPSPPVVGQSLQFNITVAPVPPGAGTPTGSVVIADGLATIGSAPVANGKATFTLPALTAGPHTFVVTYSGDNNFAASSNNLSLGPTQVAITAVPANPLLGDSVVFTATVTPLPPIQGTPTGTVTFLDNGTTVIQFPVPVTNGIATVNTNKLGRGQHTIFAVYSGDSQFQSSTGTLPLTVNPGIVTITTGSTPNPSTLGTPVTLTATLSNPAPGINPTGSVTFLDGATPLATVGVDPNGLAQAVTSSLTVGTHTLFAQYSGDANFVPVTSKGFPQQVLPGAALSVTSNINPSNAGQAVTFTVTAAAVPPTPGQPTGTVTLLDGTTPLGTANLVNGSAAFTIGNLAVGTHTISATYSGDANFAPSSSPAITQTVSLNSLFATGTDAGGGPNVVVYDGVTKQVRFNFFAYDIHYTGGVRVAVGDVTGDGYPDIITAPGPGGGPDIHIYDGRSGNMVKQFFAFNPLFTGGLFVSTGDVDGDGRAEIICGADKGGGPNVTIFTTAGNMLASFFPYDIHFTGGVRVGAGDVDADGRAEVLTVPGPGGGPSVSVYKVVNSPTLISAFNAFNLFFSPGFFVAGGDVNGDGKAEVIVGIDAGSNPTVGVYDGLSGNQLQAFFAYDPNFTGGVRVGITISNTAHANILTVAGAGGGPDVRTFDGVTDSLIDQFFAYDPRFTGGLYVAGGR